MADEVVLPIPNLQLPQNLFLLSNPSCSELHEKARKELLDGIKADSGSETSITDCLLTIETDMAPYYKTVTSASSILPLDNTLLESMEKANAEELQKLDERLAEAEKTEGESEISDALKARANYLTRIGEKVCV